MRGYARPVANHRRQSVNKAHSTSHLQSSKKRLGAIQSYLHHIKPSIGVGFKILVGAPLFCPLDGQTKGGVVVGTTVSLSFSGKESSTYNSNITWSPSTTL